MEHYFEIPVSYEGKNQLLKGRLVTFGYDFRFYIVVNGEELVFEKDEKGNFKGPGNLPHTNKSVDTELVGAIIIALQQVSVQ